MNFMPCLATGTSTRCFGDFDEVHGCDREFKGDSVPQA